jgi:adenylate kinase family enzyme
MLLHGAPGVGKTTTAGKIVTVSRWNFGHGTHILTEGIAEKFKKPLFQLTCGRSGSILV